ncbi:hypothetical protein EVA_18356 [gut metagenome]|uniref:Uncharacterized protein n=1 Tax=gut metagenome TaxID=749906 RepID=J9FVG0_9ZZZZ
MRGPPAHVAHSRCKQPIGTRHLDTNPPVAATKKMPT